MFSTSVHLSALSLLASTHIDACSFSSSAFFAVVLSALFLLIATPFIGSPFPHPPSQIILLSSYSRALPVPFCSFTSFPQFLLLIPFCWSSFLPTPLLIQIFPPLPPPTYEQNSCLLFLSVISSHCVSSNRFEVLDWRGCLKDLWSNICKHKT